MIHDALGKIYDIDVSLIGSLTYTNGKWFNSIIFDEYDFSKSFSWNEGERKGKLIQVREKAVNLKNEIRCGSNSHKKMLLKEIDMQIQKCDFLEGVFGIECYKVGIIQEVPTINERMFSRLNESLYGASIDQLHEIDVREYLIQLQHNEIDNGKIYSKDTLLFLLGQLEKYGLTPEIEFNNQNNLSHCGGVLKIKDQSEYSSREVIAIFFHEMVHYIRWKKNITTIGSRFSFHDYLQLEEGLAIYIEYEYGNKIMNYGTYIPWYDLCFKILLENRSEDETFSKLYEILKFKGFSYEKVKGYYHRFHRYSLPHQNIYLLKDLSYTSGFKKVVEYLSIRGDIGELMGGKYGFNQLSHLATLGYNKNTEFEYYDSMMNEILIL